MWVTTICHIGTSWTYYFIAIEGATYLQNIQGLSVGVTGLLIGLPNLIKVIVSIVYLTFVDNLLINSNMSKSNVRKMSGAIVSIGQGLFVLGLSFSGYNQAMAIVWYILSQIVYGASARGHIANQMDLSPNFCGVLYGIASSCGAIGGSVAPAITAAFTLNNVSLLENNYFFLRLFYT